MHSDGQHFQPWGCGIAACRLRGDGAPEELLDAPLRDDPTFSPPPTRISGGSWRVFYAATDWDTTEAEVGYHVLTAAEGSGATLYYQRL